MQVKIIKKGNEYVAQIDELPESVKVKDYPPLPEVEKQRLKANLDKMRAELKAKGIIK